MKSRDAANGLPPGVRPYDWALRQLRVAAAHRVTRGSSRVIVAVIDLGYSHHPDLTGHVLRRRGWDFADGDASLPYTGAFEGNGVYETSHHVFVAGEIACVAPRCPILPVRVGYAAPDSWWKAIRFAADQDARILVIPHGYLAGARTSGQSLFVRGGDFTYPFDNPRVRNALEYAADRGCLIIRGTADNRGRRVAFAEAALDRVMAVGSSDRHARAADICGSSDYVDVAAPGGNRHTGRASESIWGCGAGGRYVSFTGGCMAAGFAGGVAALVWSRFPELTADEVRQVLRNTARPARNVTLDDRGWEPRLGFGMLDAAKAVRLGAHLRCREVRLMTRHVRITRKRHGCKLNAVLHNRGALDTHRSMLVLYNGHPRRPGRAKAGPLQVHQIGHVIASVRGLHEAAVEVELAEMPPSAVGFELFCLDHHDEGRVHCGLVRLSGD